MSLCMNMLGKKLRIKLFQSFLCPAARALSLHFCGALKFLVTELALQGMIVATVAF